MDDLKADTPQLAVESVTAPVVSDSIRRDCAVLKCPESVVMILHDLPVLRHNMMSRKTFIHPPGMLRFTSDFQLKLYDLSIENPTASLERLREPTIFLGNNPASVEEVRDVPPWGTYLPAENIYSDAYIEMQIETGDLPKTARVSVQWRAVDDPGDNVSTTPVGIIWPERLHIVIPNETLRTFEGRQVNVSYTVHLDNADITFLPYRLVNVTKRLVYSHPVIEGVTDEGLDVSAYPHGLTVNLAAIENGQPYQRIGCSWGIFRMDGDLLIPLYDLQQSIPYEAGTKYQYAIPPEAYTGFPHDAFCMCFCSLRLVPYLSIYGWGLGGRTFPLITGKGSM
ncbi:MULTISPECIES: hypothetical protein [Pseudomonas]|uniref:hypothetical protein n=1 Tax=Pseudomonas TaxID=286 RepID=UPI0009317040|nr:MULTISPECIES: hypothetical protein [Pseudomonas]MDT8905954.1 hypothetical protein [Pseudomonas prosekii]